MLSRHSVVVLKTLSRYMIRVLSLRIMHMHTLTKNLHHVSGREIKQFSLGTFGYGYSYFIT